MIEKYTNIEAAVQVILLPFFAVIAVLSGVSLFPLIVLDLVVVDVVPNDKMLQVWAFIATPLAL